MTKYVYFFNDALTDVSMLGGKGLSLVKMSKAGYKVPPGFIISAKVQARNDELDQEIMQAFGDLNAEYVAVRSSALAEDGANTAWAGQLETYLNVTKENLLEAVENCWQSINSERAQSYAQQHNISAGSVAVVVQKMIQSEVSGIAFSAHPVTGSKEQLVIEAGLGLGEAIVSGEVTPDTYVIDKNSGEAIEKHSSIQTKKLVLQTNQNTYVTIEPFSDQKISNAKLQDLVEQLMKLEVFYKHPVDVEWAIENDQLYITQCRPITTL